MGVFRFHFIGMAQPLDLEIAVTTMGELNETISRQRFVEGRMTAPDGDGVLAAVLVATARIQCVIEAG